MKCPVCGNKAKVLLAKESFQIHNRPKFYYKVKNVDCKMCGSVVVFNEDERIKTIEKAEFDFVNNFINNLKKEWQAHNNSGIEHILGLKYGSINECIKNKKFSSEMLTIVKLLTLLSQKDKHFEIDELHKYYKFEYLPKSSPIAYKQKGKTK